MAKKQKISRENHNAQINQPVAANPPIENVAKFSIMDFKFQAVFLSLIAFVFYFNTLNHEYAFDDTMAIVDNDYVQQGVAGIPKILTTDAYQSYLEHQHGANQLAGGRYRPLSLITFAIEQQILGTANTEENTSSQAENSKAIQAEKEIKLVHDMHLRHWVNVALYIITIAVLLYFLRNIVFPEAPVIAFVATLLFCIHPIHTEVVANVKSRDEILSLLFILLTFIKTHKFIVTRQRKDLVWAATCFFGALLSKEYAATLILLLPLSIYIFNKQGIGNSFRLCWPMLIPLVIYCLLRFSSVTEMSKGADLNIMNNPYLNASVSQKLASEIAVLLRYIKLLFYPHPLVADYSFAQIPYTDFANPEVWISLLIYIVLLIALVYFYFKKSRLCFVIAFYLLNLVLISNLLFNIGAPMGERLIFHSSMGFCIALGWLLTKASEFIKPNAIANGVLALCLLFITVLSGYTTINRNKDWKNNETLFLHDVNYASNSVLVNIDAAASCMKLAKQNTDTTARKEWFSKAINYFSKALSIYPKYGIAYVNRGLCYFNSGIPDKALADWDSARVLDPALNNLAKYLAIAGKFYMGRAMRSVKDNNPNEAISAFKKALDAAPDSPEILFNLGIAYLTIGKFDDAKTALEKALQFSPGNAQILNALEAVKGNTHAN